MGRQSRADRPHKRNEDLGFTTSPSNVARERPEGCREKRRRSVSPSDEKDEQGDGGQELVERELHAVGKGSNAVNTRPLVGGLALPQED